MCYFLDAKATLLFGGEKGLAFLSEVRCIRTEKQLTECSYTETRNHRCTSAGVTCGNSASESTILTKIGTLPRGVPGA